MNATKKMEEYFSQVEGKVKEEYKVANAARKKGYDPEEKVDSPLAMNMVERVEGLISAVAPQLIGSGVTERMFELEKVYGVLDWRVSLVIAEEVSLEKFCKFKDKKEAMEVGIRVGFAYHTLGIVAAPLEGFIELNIKKRKDGKEFFSLNFAGPMRGAGGTGACVCVLIADYVRKKMGYAPYDPDEKEVKRYATELRDYHERVTNLQYFPSEEECDFLAEHVPVEISGDPTEKFDVSNYKDLPRVETNKIRGGMCLVFCMVALKAPKLWKRLEKWNDEMDMDWAFMSDFLKLQKKKKAGKEKKSEDKPKISPNTTFIADLVAGRPVLTHPLRFGGFRLRYGRTRTTGYSASAIHPATMLLLQEFIAIGTQLKVERPGKAASMTVCDAIDGPTVLLENGEVRYIKNFEEAKEVKNEVKEILFLGDILFNLGDFSENGHGLVPCGYCEEWWKEEVKEMEGAKKFLDDLYVPPSLEEAIEFAKKTKTPLHPRYTYYWTGLKIDELKELIEFFKNGRKEDGKLIVDKKSKEYLERIGIPHILTAELIVIKEGILIEEMFSKEGSGENVLEIINSSSNFEIRDKAGTFVGARMGRPEKAKMRKLKGSPHGLFPVGEEGGRLRCFQAALEKGGITADFATYWNDRLNVEEVVSVGFDRIKNKIIYDDGTFEKNEENKRFKRLTIDIKKIFDDCLGLLGTRAFPDLIKGVKGTWNKDKIVEHPLKGIIRAKHDVYVNKDGSVRYDMTEVPITHFTPKEIGITVEKVKELGYDLDCKGNEIVSEDQVIELKPQDVVLPGNTDAMEESALDVLYRVANFVDDLLVNLYQEEPYYNLKEPMDLVGQLVIGLAPHISAAMVGRIIGFSQTSGCYAHPLFHAALRRDCDGDEASVSLLLDSLLNFSRQYLPDRIGSRTMDAPLVLTPRINPSEVDDMVHGLDIDWEYSLEFYEGAQNFKMPWEVGVTQLGKKLNTPEQYEGIGYTIPTSNINVGVLVSAYKTLPSMREKLDGQMKIAEQVRAVDTKHVAKLVIEKHFIKDLKGNLRKFSMQQFRCVSCNAKYRRPPLVGSCTECHGKILFTISEGSVVKYLEPCLDLVRKYELDNYLKETIDLVKQRVDEVFGKEKDKQAGLNQWF